VENVCRDRFERVGYQLSPCARRAITREICRGYLTSWPLPSFLLTRDRFFNEQELDEAPFTEFEEAGGMEADDDVGETEGDLEELLEEPLWGGEDEGVADPGEAAVIGLPVESDEASPAAIAAMGGPGKT